MPIVETNDGTNIYYEEQGSGRPLVMIHGWGFSGRFFHRNIDALAEIARVITIDLRGHGNSDKPEHGYRISRYAKDVYDVLRALDLKEVTLLGWSLGCPVIWSYLELFGAERIAKTIFVQQTPRQYYSQDWKFAHATCFNDASFAYMKAQVEQDASTFDKNQINTIIKSDISASERDLFLDEMSKTPPFARVSIMADHTNHDWRDFLPGISLPSLVLVAKEDSVFSWQGPAWAGEHIAGAQTVFFDNSSHALFIDETDKFNRVVSQFTAGEVISNG